jgi:TonB family protein
MSSAAIEPVGWKAHHWLFLLALIFGSQVLLIYLLSARTHIPSHPLTATSASIQLVTEPFNESELSEMFLGSDPTLFAMANPHGFSGAAWLKVPERNYDLSEQPESPFWLALNPTQLGASLGQFVQTNVMALLSMPENFTPKIFASPNMELIVNAKSNSQWRIEGDLSTRSLIEEPQLKPMASSEILSNSVAQIAVDKSGMVVAVRLLSRSGSPEVDRAALALAREVRFVPSENRDLVWGKLVFDWHTVPVATTNSPAGNSK